MQLDKLLRRYEVRAGQSPRSWNDLIAGGLLSSVPTDPAGVPYAVLPGGSVGLSPRSKVNLRLIVH